MYDARLMPQKRKSQNGLAHRSNLAACYSTSGRFARCNGSPVRAQSVPGGIVPPSAGTGEEDGVRCGVWG